ncbi:hypothetical protein SPRG_12815 [Saprolegnia parasitica CBS 223.65]|uniref:Fatty acid hydroxylase domain-containing protein n=1 Tax=Saprolegnia parasitica (strain CBS 223.65) TaxID=695850 RepID=A0A067BYM1_SAPPC|nr:hypothetical protein SPRG_12815 [Saprolegnia parasitica CBS 223.65]KDO21950.1 hypothetical protein SPRG_12815 [Saprolegnia parasitica CBS 223.65]|eukprot:XP_012207294.1 hypothetical protein SPRG_12815 [Saprolegnia parasitica CBS 223.65]
MASTHKAHLLDVFVYGPDEAPPLHALAGFPYFILTIAHVQLGHFVWLHGMGFTGCVIYTLLSFGSIVLDGLANPSLGKNLQTLRCNGFSDTLTATRMSLNLISNVVMTWLVFQELCGPDAVASTLRLGSYSPYTVAAIAANIGLTEVLFYFAHKCLHEVLPRIHLMHHCCFYPTHSTNFIFDPIDFAFELGMPTAFLFVNHFVLWQQDHVVLLVSYMIVQQYYALDHSDFLQLHHFKHHARLDDMYTAYIKYHNPRNTKFEAVRKIMQRPAKHA